jgi:hypothetical protein
MRSRCIALLPNAGLGNILFPWANAHLFGALNGMPASALGWGRPHIGPLLRGQRQWRYYSNPFRQLASQLAATGFLAAHGRIVRNPPVERVANREKEGQLFIWDQIPHWKDAFGSVRQHRDFVKELIWTKLKSHLRLHVMQAAAPVVAVHIRRGDFRELRPGEDFRKVGSTRTPLEYFVSTIEQIRVCHGSDLPVTVFTDGYPSEIGPVLALPAVRLATPSTPIFDLLLMSRASLIVTSAGSTFGYWAGFLADAPVLLHPEHIHAPHRPKYINKRYFEGPAVGRCETWPNLLVANINDLCISSV